VGPEENGKAVVVLWPPPLLYKLCPCSAPRSQLVQLLWHVYAFCKKNGQQRKLLFSSERDIPSRYTRGGCGPWDVTALLPLFTTGSGSS
jgi:hypothetical protein